MDKLQGLQTSNTYGQYYQTMGIDKNPAFNNIAGNNLVVANTVCYCRMPHCQLQKRHIDKF